MIDTLLVGLADYLHGMGPPFAAGFLFLLAAFAYFHARWSGERLALGAGGEDLESVLRSLEQPDGALHRLLAGRVTGAAAPSARQALQTPAAFDRWLAEHRICREAGQGRVLKDYLYRVLTTPRPRLRAGDNRILLTASRNLLRRYSYHRVVNVLLASVAVSLGLLGTVAGLWLAFRQADFSEVAKVGDGLTQVMLGLSRALYTTGTGLLLSIPMLAVGLRMERDLERIYGQLEEVRDAVVATVEDLSTDEPGHADLLREEAS